MHPKLRMVLRRIAAHEGCDPEELPPMYDSVDTYALTRLLESQPEVCMRFDYYKYRVTVEPEGVDVSEQPDR